jgi:hypothetical protein
VSLRARSYRRGERVPIHVFVAGSADDPRTAASIPGVAIHRGPPLHPDDVTTHDGIPITSPSCTLIDEVIDEFCITYDGR